MKHAFTRDILLCNEAFQKCDELIKEIETHHTYQKAILSNKNEDYLDESRNNSVIAIHHTASPLLLTLMKEVHATIQQGIILYQKYNPFMQASQSLGFDLLKYEIGEKFHQHVDLVPGHKVFGKRQLSVLIYLNDDYQGGETQFIRQELELKPPKGSLALFPPFYTHPHSSLPITQGTKKILVSWVDQ